MKVIMPQIKKEWYDQLLVIDGNSTDGTLEYVKEQGYPYYVQKKKGMRHAYIESLPLIEGDVILIFSPDGNSVPERIPDCINKMKEGYDMVIVSRYAKGAKSEDDDMVTGFGNWMFRKCLMVTGCTIFNALKNKSHPKKSIIPMAIQLVEPRLCLLHRPDGSIIERPDSVRTFTVTAKSSFFKAYEYIKAGTRFEITIFVDDELIAEEHVKTLLSKAGSIGVGAFRERFGKFVFES